MAVFVFLVSYMLKGVWNKVGSGCVYGIMRKGKTSNGVKCFKVSVQMEVTLAVFVTAVTDRLFCGTVPRALDLLEDDAELILLVSLAMYGEQGRYPDGHFESSQEGDAYNEFWGMVKEWVLLHYPYLAG